MQHFCSDSVLRKSAAQSIRSGRVESGPSSPSSDCDNREGLFGRLHWKFNGSAKIPIHWLQDGIDSYKPDFGSFNPEKEISFQFFVAHEPNRWDLHVNQSHSLCDGAGYFRFLHDLLIVYNQLCRSEDVQLPEADPARLKWRGSQKFRFRSFLSIIPIKMAGFFVALSLFRRQVPPTRA